MDDIKLLAANKSRLSKITKTCVNELAKIGLSINPDKSKSNAEIDIIEKIETPMTYKYLGIDESPSLEYTGKTIARIEEEIASRLDLLLNSQLNAKILITAINEWVISLTDYPTGIVETES